MGKLIDFWVSSRGCLIVIGLFLYTLAYTTFYNEELVGLPTHGPLILYSIIGGTVAIVGAFSIDEVNIYRSRILAFAILISYSIIRGLNFASRAIQNYTGFWNIISHFNAVAIWFFVAYLTFVIYILWGRIND